jgi:hypothetical protein
MLKERDEEWLRINYPTLTPGGDGVAGTLEFRAAYKHDTNRFVILGDQVADEYGAVTLTGSFDVQIQERRDKSTSRLPALHVKGIETIPERHFNQRDQSACLCSPLEEWQFLEPEFRFVLYLEQLVIPFLYGQVFYSSHRRWPWSEYAHGATGILEAYSKVCDQARAEECVRQLRQDACWSRIQSALRQKSYIKGHTPCFCSRMDQIRRCHPDALQGALRLQRDLTALGISIG